MKKMKQLIFLVFITSFLVIGTIPNVQAATTHYEGYVKDEWNNPLQNAKVELLEWGVYKKSVYTSSTGYYSIYHDTDFYTIYSIRASKAGYVTQSIGVLSRPPRGQSSIVRNFNLELEGPIESTFKGYIRDNSDPLQYIEGARVYLKYVDDNQENIILKTVTGSNGLYEFPTVEHEDPKTFTLEAYKSGVRGQTIATTGSISATHWNNFYLDAGRSYVVILGMLGINLVNQWIDYYMNEMCYDEVYVYGDPSIGTFDQYTADAYENNIETKLLEIKGEVDSWDIFSFIAESHGGENTGDIWILDGFITKNELKDWLPTNSRTFVYLGTCYSAYMKDALKTTSSNQDLFIITATTYSETYPIWSLFLLKILNTDYVFNKPMSDDFVVGHDGNDISMETAYSETYLAYDWLGGGYPPGSKWDGNTSAFFYL